MKVSSQALDVLIKPFEGIRYDAYPDPANAGGLPWTIGYGHTKGVKAGDKITLEQAEAFLAEDVAEVEVAINRHVRVELNQNQIDAIADFIFNLGESKFRNSTLLGKLNSGDFEGAADEFPKWKFAGGKVNKGIQRRRAAELAMFLKKD